MKAKPLRPLTDDERELVEQNARLLDAFLSRRRLAYDEWYGIAAMGLLYAAQAYDPKRGAFSTLAFTAMQNEINKEITRRKRVKRKANYGTISLDQPLYENGPTLAEGIADPTDHFDDVEGVELSADLEEHLQKRLTYEQKQILEMRLQGRTYREIAEHRGCTYQNVGNILAPIKAEIAVFLRRRKGENVDEMKFRWSYQTRSKALQLNQDGHSPEKIAEEIGCPVQKVLDLLKKQKIQTPVPPAGDPTAADPPAEPHAESGLALDPPAASEQLPAPVIHVGEYAFLLEILEESLQRNLDAINHFTANSKESFATGVFELGQVQALLAVGRKQLLTLTGGERDAS